ncbi:MAG: hypothetical protein QOJ40_465 [Verrucomicrobiota bacterium]
MNSRLLTAGTAIVFWAAPSMGCFAQPINDDFTNRIILTGYTNVLTISTVGATVERGEPNANFTAEGYPSVWYSWTAPEAGTALLSYSGDNYVRYFAVFTGTQLRSLRRTGRTDTFVNFETKPGQVFQIQVMAPTTTPPFDMHLDFVPRPANDSFTNRLHLEGVLVSTNGNTVAATREPGEPRHNKLRFGRSVWYAFTAPASGWLFVNLTDCPPLICEAYTGRSIHRLRAVDGTLLNQNPFSGILAVEPGVEYEFAVDGQFYYDKVVYAGPFTLNLDFTGLTLVAPAGNSILIGPDQIELLATNTLPDFDGNIDGLTFYALNLLDHQEKPLADSSGPLFHMTWSNPPNGYYQLQARGTNTDGRSVQSNPAIISIEPSNNDFSKRITLAGTNVIWPVDFAAATRARTDPKVAKYLNDDFDGATLWWTWTAPTDGTVTLSCDNWTIAIGIYLGHPEAFRMVMTPCWGSGQFQAKAGQIYQILLSDRYPPTAPSQGTMTLNLQRTE